MSSTDTDLRALAEQATPGPWRACVWDPMERPHVHKDMPDQTRCSPPDLPLTKADAAYIAAANPAAILNVLDSWRESTELLVAAERRVAALEEGLRQLAGAVEWMFAGTDELVAPGPMQKAHDKARALLAERSDPYRLPCGHDAAAQFWGRCPTCAAQPESEAGE